MILLVSLVQGPLTLNALDHPVLQIRPLLLAEQPASETVLLLNGIELLTTPVSLVTLLVSHARTQERPTVIPAPLESF